MANTRASIREIRKSGRRAVGNRRVVSRIKTLQKAASDEKADAAAVTAFISTLDKAAKSGVIHRNKANRLKSKATRRLQAAAK